MSSRKPRFNLEEDGEEVELHTPDIVLSNPDSPTPGTILVAGEEMNPEVEKHHSYPPTPTSDHPPSKKATPTPSTHENEEMPSGLTAEAAKPNASKLHSLIPPRKLPGFLAWIPPKLNRKGLRPVLRASIAGWCGLILVLDPRSEKVLGQASFLVLIVATIHPASIPVASMLEQSFFQIIFVALAWAWACLALLLAHKARTRYQWTIAEFQAHAAAPYANSTLTAAEISTEISKNLFHGAYLETGSSAVCGVFLAVGGGWLLWLRGHWGPGPALFGIIFGIIMLSITLTIGCVFPYPYYGIGLIFFLPFICQQAIALLVSFIIVPETLAHQFCDRLIATLTPLQTVVRQQKAMLEANPRTEEWLEFKSIRQNVAGALGGLALLGTCETNLTREISYARVPGKDLSRVLGWVRLLVSKSTGFVRFYDIVESHLHRDFSDARGGPVVDDLVIHLGHSRHTSPNLTLQSTRPPSPTRRDSEDNVKHHRSDSPSSHHLNPPLASPPHEIGVVHHPSPLAFSPSTTDLDHAHLHSSTPNLRREGSSTSLSALEEVPDASHHRNGSHSRPRSVKPKRPRSHHKGRHGQHGSGTFAGLAKSASGISLPSLLHDVLHPNIDIRPVGLGESQRYMDLEDYLRNPQDEEHIEEIISLLSAASSELLTACDSSITHLMTVIHRIKSSESIWQAIFKEDPTLHLDSVNKSEQLTTALEAAIKNYRDTKRLDVVKPFASLFDPFVPRDRETFRSPSHRGLFWAFSLQFSLLGWGDALLEMCQGVSAMEKKRRTLKLWYPEWSKWKWNRGDEDFEEEAPHNISGYSPQVTGFRRKEFSSARHPDYVAPQTLAQVAGIKIYDATQIFTRPDVLFAVKSAVLIALLSLPAFWTSTTYFFYSERGVWVLIMAALTSSNYVGDTSFGFSVRAVGTLAGAIAGMIIWYIGAGGGHGNPYGMAAIAAVTFPLIFFVRVHFTPPVSAIFPCVTACLVIGYSWQDANQPSLSSVGWGWDVAWRRCVCVWIGVTAAYLWALLPPKATQKETVRHTYARVINETGGVLCQILSFANCKDEPCKPPKQIIANISALRIKVGKTTASRAMIRYELSLRGAWPENYYASLQTLQMEILDLLGQLLAVLASSNGVWTKAIMHRSQLSNPRFLGEVLTTFQLISASLGHANPLPMIYNPLLELYLRPEEVLTHHHPYGFEATLDHIEGIPQHVDLQTICSLEYLSFSCGISLTYAIINRLDRLMFVAKSLVGESYIVYGLPDLHTSTRHTPAENLRQRWEGDLSARNSTDDFGAGGGGA